MNKCDNCVKDIDTCNICTYNLEKTYGRKSSNIGDYSIMEDYEYHLHGDYYELDID